jgi:diguanylate cyclase (GGDEF)-like protein/PAS domain S-box-containing protein
MSAVSGKAHEFLSRTPVAAVLLGSDATILDANEWVHELLGYEAGALVGANALDFVHPEHLERSAQNLEGALGRSMPAAVRMSVPVRRASGDWVDLLCVGVNLSEEEGFGGLLVSVRPVEGDAGLTARRRGWFEAVVSGTDDIVQVLDEDGRILWASGPVESLLGIPPDALVGLKIEQLRHEPDPAQARVWLREVKRRPADQPLTVAAQREIGGRSVHLEVRSTNLLDDPEVGAIIITTRDITQRVEAEEARRFAAEVLERAPVAFLTTDPKGVITMVNPEVERITGWRAEEAVGHRFRDLGGQTSESLEVVLGARDQIVTGGTVEYETEIRAADGQLVPVYLGVTGMLSGDGDYVGNMIFALDLREQTRVRKALARSEAHWLTLSQHAQELVALVDQDGVVEWAGQGFKTLLGHDTESLVGRSILELVHEDDRERPGALHDLAGDERETSPRERRLCTADGDWRVFDINVNDLRADPAVGAFLVTGSDVTDRVAAEADNRRMAAAMESSGAAVVITDTQGRILSWNREAERLSGQTAESLLGRRLEIGNPVPADRQAELVASLSAGATVTYEIDQLRRDGTLLTMSITASPVTDAAGAVTGFSFIGFDVTAQRDAAHERDARAAQARALAALGQEALSGSTVPDVLEDACELAADALGIGHVHVLLTSDDRRQHEIAAAVGHFAGDVGRRDPVEHRPWARAVDEQRQPVVVTDFDSSEGGRPAALDDVAVRSGVICAIEGRDGPIGYLVVLGDEPRSFTEGDVAFLQAIANVLATTIERARVNDEMQRRALHDELTGLPNRALLVDRLSQAVSRLARREGTVGLLFIDLDRFKRVNDTLGHQAGDELLVATAQRLLDAVRVGDTVARTGGDEFLVLTEEITDPAGAVTLAERVAAAIAEPVLVDGHGIHVTASIGVAIADASSDPEELIRDADLAMYRAKQDGRDRIQVFDASMHDDAVTGMAMEEALRSAVNAHAVRVVFQPQVSMVDGKVVGIEALARWEHPRLGEVPPSAFVGVAEEIGILDDITRAVLSATCATVADLRRQRPDLRAAVNLTPRQLARRKVIGLVDEALREAGLPAEALVVEVTETASLDDPASLKILGELRQRGVHVSIDDFGTGYSSLARVTHLPVDEVKIDRSFVNGVAEDRGCAAAVSAIVTLSRVLGLRLVAEGVEKPIQRQALLELGCTEGQGWLFSGPLEPADLGPWLEANGC